MAQSVDGWWSSRWVCFEPWATRFHFRDSFHFRLVGKRDGEERQRYENFSLIDCRHGDWFGRCSPIKLASCWSFKEDGSIGFREFTENEQTMCYILELHNALTTPVHKTRSCSKLLEKIFIGYKRTDRGRGRKTSTIKLLVHLKTL